MYFDFLVHVPPTNMEEAGTMTSTATSHQEASLLGGMPD